MDTMCRANSSLPLHRSISPAIKGNLSAFVAFPSKLSYYVFLKFFLVLFSLAIVDFAPLLEHMRLLHGTILRLINSYPKFCSLLSNLSFKLVPQIYILLILVFHPPLSLYLFPHLPLSTTTATTFSSTPSRVSEIALSLTRIPTLEMLPLSLLSGEMVALSFTHLEQISL